MHQPGVLVEQRAEVGLVTRRRELLVPEFRSDVASYLPIDGNAQAGPWFGFDDKRGPDWDRTRRTR